MGWFFSQRSDNELGEYLPDEKATLQQGSEYLEASSKPEAKEKCDEVASEYNAVESSVEPAENEGGWMCNFKFWG